MTIPTFVLSSPSLAETGSKGFALIPATQPYFSVKLVTKTLVSPLFTMIFMFGSARSTLTAKNSSFGLRILPEKYPIPAAWLTSGVQLGITSSIFLVCLGVLSLCPVTGDRVPHEKKSGRIASRAIRRLVLIIVLASSVFLHQFAGNRFLLAV